MKCPKCNNNLICKGWDIFTNLDIFKKYSCNSCNIVIKRIGEKISIFVGNQKFEDETIRFVNEEFIFDKEKFHKFVDNIIFA